MLASLLPGLRDLRAPLAAGYLWLAAGWLYFAPKLPVSIDDTQGILRDIYRVVEASSPVLVGAGLTFAAYLIGILSTGLLARFTRGILFVLALPLFFALGVIVFLMIFTEDRLPTIAKRIDDMMERMYRRYIKLYGSSTNRTYNLVIRKLSASILANQDQYQMAMKHLVQEDIDHYMSVIRRWRGPYVHRRIMKKGQEQKLIEIREGLSSSIEKRGDRQAAEALVEMTINIDRHARDILDELKLIPERIVGNRPSTYERWDRLSAEGEFRQAVVPPLGAMTAVLVVREVLKWQAALLLAIPILVILAQGVGKEHEAQGQLLQTLEAGTIDAVSVQRLTSTDLYWVH